jgi:hypothetical protein
MVRRRGLVLRLHRTSTCIDYDRVDSVCIGYHDYGRVYYDHADYVRVYYDRVYSIDKAKCSSTTN